MKINQPSQQESLTGLEQIKPTLFVKIIFFAFGVSSLSGWNATLTALDYFQDQYKDYNIYFDFPLPMFSSSCLMGLIIPKIAQYFSLTFKLAWTLIAVCVVIVLMPLVAKWIPGLEGFLILMCLIFVLGLINSFQSGTAIGIASVLGGEYVGIYCIGTGFSGAIICIFRMICLAVLKDDAALSCLVYFCVAAAWNIFSVFLYLGFQKTEHYAKIESGIDKREEVMTASTNEIDNLKASTISDTSAIYQYDPMKSKINSMNIFQVMLYVNKITFPVPLCIILIYIQTFMMFPGLSLEKTFPPSWEAWGPTLLIFNYGIGDTVGKQLADYRNLYTEKIQIVIIFLRFAFYATFYLIVIGTIEAYWFTFVNLFLFAVTNGFTTGGLFQIGPEKVPDYMKEKVGFVQGFSLVFGIMLGSFLAFPLQTIKQTN